ncbi:MAG: hypothetical protein SFX18_16005 [Pirellulales bacterium]|nr:hypothetical protein [Pirellulales bacterium]
MTHPHMSETLTAPAELPAHTFPGERLRLRRKLLFLVPTVPPVPIAGAFVIKNLLSQLDPRDVVVGAEFWPDNPPDQTSMEGGFPVHFVCRKWTWPPRGQQYVHWLKWLFIRQTARRIARVILQNGCQAIFCNFPDELLLFSAYLAAEWTQLPLYTFFHNTYRENRTGWRRWIADYLQPRVFARSEQVFVMSAGMQRGLEKLYPGQAFTPLVHTFAEPIPPFESLPPWQTGRIRVGFLGSVNESNLDALHRFRALVAADSRYEWNIYSNSSSWFLQKVGFVGERIDHTSPSDEDLPGKLRDNDLLLLPHGFSGGLTPIEYETIFPTRTIPYLLSGRPIVAFSPPHSYLNAWLAEHDCAEIVDQPDHALLRARIDALAANPARQAQLVHNALSAARQFQARTVVTQLVEKLNAQPRFVASKA